MRKWGSERARRVSKTLWHHRLLSHARWCPVPASPPPTLEQLARPCRLASAGAWRDCGSAGGLLLLGWSCQCLQDWGPFFSLAVPSMLMLCIEWWAYEIGSFLSGQCGHGRGGPAERGLAGSTASAVPVPQVPWAWWSWEPSPSCTSWLSSCTW